MKDTVEVIIRYPNGAGGSRLTIRNDGTGTKQRGNYECEFFYKNEERPAAKWRLRGFKRYLGIEGLVSCATEMLAQAALVQDTRRQISDTVYGGDVERDVEPPSPQERADELREIIRWAWGQLEEIEAAVPDARKPLDLELPSPTPTAEEGGAS